MTYSRFAVFLAAPLTLGAPVLAEEVAVALPVVTAEVFPQGARLRLETVVDLPAGDHTIHTVLPAWLVEGGVPKLDASADVLGTRISPTLSYDIEAFDSAVVTQARSGVEAAEALEDGLRDQLARIGMQLAALDAKSALLRSVGGGDTLPSGEALVALADTIVDQLGAVATARMPLTTQSQSLEQELEDARGASERARAHLARVGGGDNPMVQVSVDLRSDGTPVLLGTDIFERNAGWQMRYEANLRQTGGADLVELARQVMVRQSSGLAWVDVALRLSTAQPSGQVDPTPVNRSIAQVYDRQQPKVMSRSAPMEAPMMESAVVMMEMSSADAMGGAALFSANFDGPVVSYDLPQAVTLYGGNDTTLLALSALEFEAARYLAAAPRFDKTAFVAVDITNTSLEPVFEGPAEFLRDGVLVGSGYLNALPAGAETTLAFGPEVSVALEVEFLDKQSGDRGFIRTTNTREDAVRVTLRNLSDEPRDVVMRYAVPTSQQEDLEIDVALSPNPDTRDADDKKGVMEWDIALAAGEEKQVSLDFEMSWPEGQTLNWRP